MRARETAGEGAGLGRFLAERHREIVLGLLFLALPALAVLAPDLLGRAAVWVPFGLLLGGAGASLGFFWPKGRPAAPRLFLGGLAAALALAYGVRLTGGLCSPYFPFYFVVLILFPFGPRKVLVAGGLLFSILALEGSIHAGGFLAGRASADGPLFLGYGVALSLATLAAGILSHRLFGWASGVKEDYDTLTRTARSLERMGRDDAADSGSLSRETATSHWVGAALRLDERLQHFLELAAGALGAERCGIFLVDEAGEYLTLRHVHPPPAEGTPPLRVPMSGTYIAGVLRSGGPPSLILGKVDPADRRSTRLRTQVPSRSTGVARISMEGAVIGALAAESSAADAFRGKKELLEGMARLAGDLFLFSHRLSRVEEEGRRHESLLLASNALARCLREDDILGTFLTETAGLLGHRVAAYFTLPDGEHLTLRMSRGLPKETVGQTFPLGKSLLAYVPAHRQPLLFSDLGEGGKRAPAVAGLPLEASSLLAVPVLSGEKIAGVYLAADPRPGWFDRSHLFILETLANQVSLQLDNARLHDRMEAMAVTDGLTGLFNHRFFHESLERELARVRRHPEPLSLILLDIDHFKKVNDTYGHPFGDVVLKGVAGVLRDLARESDLAARYGGEEMALLLLNTNRKGAGVMAARVQTGIRNLRFDHEGKEVRVAASLGSATFPEDGKSATALVEGADAALYHSKHTGRDRYTAAGSLEKGKG
jgi:diguanylate cyclase (GGDEF)-like protein